jgi:hypothetical protein
LPTKIAKGKEVTGIILKTNFTCLVGTVKRTLYKLNLLIYKQQTGKKKKHFLENEKTTNNKG